MYIDGRKQIKERTINIKSIMKSFLKRTGVLYLLILLLPAISYAEIYSGSCSQNELLRWRLDTETGLFEIFYSQSGTYDMCDYWFDPKTGRDNPAPWYKYRTYIRRVNLSGINNIGMYAFYGCGNLTSIAIPESVTKKIIIDDNIFKGCSSLISVELNSIAIASAKYSSSNNLGKIFGSQVKEYTFGDDIKRIGEYAFASSTEVTSIVLGRNIERIQDYAFSGCDKLEEVRVKNPEPPIAYNTAFTDNAYYAVLYVPEGSEALYKEDNVWKKFARIRTFKDEPKKCVLAIKSAIGGYLEMICNTQTSYTFNIKTEKGWQVSSVSFNGADVTANITDDSYTTPLLEGDSELSVIFEMDQDEIDMVNEVETHSQLSVTASASTIYIHNDGSPVNSYIYTTDGKMVKSVVASYGKTVIPVQPDNVYVVKVNNRTFKVAL